MFVGCDAATPAAALKRMLSVTLLRADAAGIKLEISSGFAAIAVHLVPLVLYSMRFETPVTVSFRLSKARPAGGAGIALAAEAI